MTLRSQGIFISPSVGRAEQYVFICRVYPLMRSVGGGDRPRFCVPARPFYSQPGRAATAGDVQPRRFPKVGA
jgi:hypothetical protein